MTGNASYCPPDSNGQDSLGYRHTYRYPTAELTRSQALGRINNPRGGLAPVEQTSLRCLYPPSYVDTRVTCVVRVDVTIDQRRPVTRNLASQQVPTAYAGSRSLADCLTSELRVPLFTEVTDFGRYVFASTSHQQACYNRTYTSNDPRTNTRPANELVNCGGVYLSPGTPGYWELTCSGLREGWSSSEPDYTMDGCMTEGAPGQGQVQCLFTDSNTLSGQALDGPAQLFRDGVKRPVTFAVPQLVGSGITVNGATTVIERDPSSTPWDDLTPFASPSRAEFKVFRGGVSALRSPTETGPVAGTVGDGWEVAAWWASHARQPTSINARYDYDISILVQSIAVVGVYPLTGQVETESRTISVPTSVTCRSSSVVLDYLRATNG